MFLLCREFFFFNYFSEMLNLGVDNDLYGPSLGEQKFPETRKIKKI